MKIKKQNEKENEQDEVFAAYGGLRNGNKFHDIMSEL